MHLCLQLHIRKEHYDYLHNTVGVVNIVLIDHANIFQFSFPLGWDIHYSVE